MNARRVAVAVGLAVTGMLVVLGTRQPALTIEIPSPLTGHPAPTLAGTTLSGATFRLDGLRGRFVLVNFFATWCVPCQQEHADLAAFNARHAAAGDATVVSVVFKDDRDHVRRFFADRGGDWPVVTDTSGRTALDFGVTGVPESYLVDPAGVVVAKIAGGVRADALEALLQRARAGEIR